MLLTICTIFLLQICYVSLITIRMILTVKGYRYVAAVVSCIDIMIYVIGLKLVLDNLDKPINLLVYCLSYGIGILIGIKIEEWLALGFVTVQVTTNGNNADMAAGLRQKGYGVTGWLAEGLEGERFILTIIIARKLQSRLYQDILLADPQAFIVSYEPKYFRGGFLKSNRYRIS
ncbi:Uncharacterized protein YebE, UPF0316 family [Bacillus sp. OV166]|uniref:DUF2179 domain-containing protein n=1 Tax=Bacillus sp. OV166 TaxID=1882763 RepID=UPI000A2AB9C7|nr:DUF5698 domain-containing protein [Bacillus sp. OV166]SMQ62671.1 Uncharacterized protein YebE, UPF0316 family [Bacillus sp. OV166]